VRVKTEQEQEQGEKLIGHFPFSISHFPFVSERPVVQRNSGYGSNRSYFTHKWKMRNGKWKMTNKFFALPLLPAPAPYPGSATASRLMICYSVTLNEHA